VASRDLVLAVPAFAGVSTAVIDSYLEQAAQAHRTDGWGNVYVQALAYYAMHLMAQDGVAGYVAGSAGGYGVVTNRTTGGISVGHATPATRTVSPGDMWLTSTRWGLRYLHLRGSRFGRARAVVAAGSTSAATLTQDD